MMPGNRGRIAILFLTLAVIMLGYGMIIPIAPFYVKHLGAGGRQLGLLIACYALMQFIFAPIWGGVSDRIGRKPVLMLGVLGNGLSMLFFGLATRLWMLFAARSLAGMLSSATLPTAMAYIGDCTTKEERGGGMGKMAAASGLGVILGPGLGGWLATRSLSMPFFVAAGLSLLSLLLVCFLPESLPVESHDRPETAARIRELWRALRSPIGILLFLAFLVSFGLTNFEGIFGLYALEKFHYGPGRVGTILMIIGLVTTIAQAVLTGPLTKRWGETAVIKVSLLASSGAFLVLLSADTYSTILLTTGFFILSKTLLRPAVTSLTSQYVTHGQGVAMGLNSSFSSLGLIVGPIWAGFAFDLYFDYPYLSGAAIMFVGFLKSLAWVSRDVPGQDPANRCPE